MSQATTKKTPSRKEAVMANNHSSPANDPRQAGRIANRAELFGPFSRYKVAAVHTRFERVEWFVWDAEVPDDVTGNPSVIRQAVSRDEAMAGLGD